MSPPAPWIPISAACASSALWRVRWRLNAVYHGSRSAPEPATMNPDLQAEAIATFNRLLDEARAAGDREPTAMTLATVGADGRVSARVVLLKAVDERGFVFYTNTLSRKGRALAASPKAALDFHWKSLARQVRVRIEGSVAPVTVQEADTCFASRPRESQLGAGPRCNPSRWPSAPCSSTLRAVRTAVAVAGAAPPHWSGYRGAGSLRILVRRAVPAARTARLPSAGRDLEHGLAVSLIRDWHRLQKRVAVRSSRINRVGRAVGSDGRRRFPAAPARNAAYPRPAPSRSAYAPDAAGVSPRCCG